MELPDISMKPIDLEHDGYLITTDKSKLDPVAAHEWLSKESYWSKYIPMEVVQAAFDNSYVIGVLHEGKQVGYARLVTDYASYAWLGDVYVLEEHRGKGLSKKMLGVLMELDWVKKLRTIALGTLDAQGLYAQFGFKNHENPERMMFLMRREIYGDGNDPCR